MMNSRHPTEHDVPGTASWLRPDHPKPPDVAAPGYVRGKGNAQPTTRRTGVALASLTLARASADSGQQHAQRKQLCWPASYRPYVCDPRWRQQALIEEDAA